MSQSTQGNTTITIEDEDSDYSTQGNTTIIIEDSDGSDDDVKIMYQVNNSSHSTNSVSKKKRSKGIFYKGTLCSTAEFEYLFNRETNSQSDPVTLSTEGDISAQIVTENSLNIGENTRAADCVHCNVGSSLNTVREPHNSGIASESDHIDETASEEEQNILPTTIADDQTSSQCLSIQRPNSRIGVKCDISAQIVTENSLNIGENTRAADCVHCNVGSSLNTVTEPHNSGIASESDHIDETASEEEQNILPTTIADDQTSSQCLSIQRPNSRIGVKCDISAQNVSENSLNIAENTPAADCVHCNVGSSLNTVTEPHNSGTGSESDLNSKNIPDDDEQTPYGKNITPHDKSQSTSAHQQDLSAEYPEEIKIRYYRNGKIKSAFINQKDFDETVSKYTQTSQKQSTENADETYEDEFNGIEEEEGYRNDWIAYSDVSESANDYAGDYDAECNESDPGSTPPLCISEDNIICESCINSNDKNSNVRQNDVALPFIRNSEEQSLFAGDLPSSVPADETSSSVEQNKRYSEEQSLVASDLPSSLPADETSSTVEQNKSKETACHGVEMDHDKHSGHNKQEDCRDAHVDQCITPSKKRKLAEEFVVEDNGDKNKASRAENSEEHPLVASDLPSSLPNDEPSLPMQENRSAGTPRPSQVSQHNIKTEPPDNWESAHDTHGGHDSGNSEEQSLFASYLPSSVPVDETSSSVEQNKSKETVCQGVEMDHDKHSEHIKQEDDTDTPVDQCVTPSKKRKLAEEVVMEDNDDKNKSLREDESDKNPGSTAPLCVSQNMICESRVNSKDKNSDFHQHDLPLPGLRTSPQVHSVSPYNIRLYTFNEPYLPLPNLPSSSTTFNHDNLVLHRELYRGLLEDRSLSATSSCSDTSQ